MFKSANLNRLSLFDSDASYRLLEAYNNSVDNYIQASRTRLPSKKFAPSSLRCMRRSWFRLRGVAPDNLRTVDTELQFAADMGTACHELIQQRLIENLQDNWISVSDYLDTTECTHKYVTSANGLETTVEFFDIPVKFSVDGIVRLGDRYYLLEIKTVPYSVWDELASPRGEHIDQVKCYSTLLDIDNCIMMYQDRQYGKVKCYEVTITDADKQSVLHNMQYVLDCVDNHIAPERLPKGDKWCSPTYCPYYEKCKEY